MSGLPRVAVGTIQREADCQAILWALMEAFRRLRVQVQSFLSRACFPMHPGASVVTGLTPRHLDSWLMSPEMCRDVFVRGARAADLAVVDGKFDPAVGSADSGGKLEPLCRWLNLPRLVVLDVSRLGVGRLPARPEQADGLFLDRVADLGQSARLTTDIEALWGIPVLGSLEKLPALRAQLARVPRGDRPPLALCHPLGDQFSRSWQPKRIFQIAERDGPPKTSDAPLHRGRAGGKLTLAVAYDEAFNCYFPDTLDLLELQGAAVVDFSPLRDESLPPEADVVYLGCGHPERSASALSENHCMKAALRSHLRAGRRIYGEGGGLAYLCQQMETPGGQLSRMVGILPAAARLKRPPTSPEPVEVTLAQPSWLGDRGARLRGYRNPNWDLEPVGRLAGFVSEENHRHDLVGSFQAIGSLLHLNFAAQPEFLARFFHPCLARPGVPDPWNAAP